MALMFLKAIFFFLTIYVSKSSAELIISLPGQPGNVSFKQYSGSIITNVVHGRSLFYYFVEADSADPLTRPLTLWLNGGPGCSSLGIGAFMEHGPFQPAEDGTLKTNPYSWNLESNMLYVESPIGVGFSYSNRSEDYIEWNDTKTAEENLRFLVRWLDEFPQYKDSDFYLTGESYAGHYIPQLATLLLEYNKKANVKPINFKAIALGNPLLDLDISIDAANYLWAHGAISDDALMLERTVCNESRFLKEYYHSEWSQECNDVFNIVDEEIGDDISRDDLLLPVCTSKNYVEQLKIKGKRATIHAKLAKQQSTGDPCLQDRILSYLNRPEVQKALHANLTHLPFHWAFCEGPLLYQEENMDMNLIPMVADIIKAGIPIMLFSGDQDTKIPLTQTRIVFYMLAKNLNLVPFTDYGPWYNKKQIGGWAQSFGALKDGKNVTYLTYATARGAAHEVPFTNPSIGLALFQTFLNGTSLPVPRKDY